MVSRGIAELGEIILLAKLFISKVFKYHYVKKLEIFEMKK